MKDIFANLQLDKKQILLIVIFSVLFIYLDYTFLLSAQWKALGAIDTKAAQLTVEINTVSRESARIQNLQKQQKDTAKSPQKKIIAEEELVALLSQVSALANSHSVKIIQMKPGQAQAASQEAARKAAKFSPVGISLDLICNYHSLIAFIESLENAQIFLAVKDLRISRQAGDYFTEKVNLELLTYVSK